LLSPAHARLLDMTESAALATISFMLTNLADRTFISRSNAPGRGKVLRRCLLVAVGLMGFLVLLAHGVSAASLRGRTVVLDPGHGANTGARGVAETVEDVNVLAIAAKARALLEADGVRVIMTRTANQVPTVPELPNAGQLLARMPWPTEVLPTCW